VNSFKPYGLQKQLLWTIACICSPLYPSAEKPTNHARLLSATRSHRAKSPLVYAHTGFSRSLHKEISKSRRYYFAFFSFQYRFEQFSVF
jgi:hypothetical protein